ncbi:hypothetical protein BKA65DRAFT_294822 [Rhexocercosporidium sp. MPI-PUGE-AT-0058]|nr:hypothetical protein BKA65DRAFT_294822 [Rhexocercosporidium sp. MPI-PUGE-AT-0058]
MGLSYWKRALLHVSLLSVFAFEKSAAALAFTNPSLAGLAAGAPFYLISPYNITWSGATGTTTLTLRNGTENNLDDVDTIATGIERSFFVWTPLANILPGEYSFQLKDDSSDAIAYSSVFRILAPGETSRVVTAVGPELPATESPEPQPIPDRPAPSHPNISLTAKIGVAVGSVLLTLLVIGIVVCYRRRHRSPVARSSMSASSDQFLHEGGAKMPAEMYEPRRPPPVELERGRRERRSQERSAERWR